MFETCRRQEELIKL